MRLIGFSTGAIARGDFRTALDVLRSYDVEAVELSALREFELVPLTKALPALDLSGFEHVSFHAPSRVLKLDEARLIDALLRVAEAGLPVVVHPDVIHDTHAWRSLGESLLLENMDRRKHIGRTLEDLNRFFDALPEAGLCVDVGHAKQVDPTLSLLADLLTVHAERIRQLHVSQVDARSAHRGLSYQDIDVLCQVRSLLPEHAPVILESSLAPNEIAFEVDAVRNCLALDTVQL